MTREQQYIQEQYMRRQSLLRHAAIIAGGAYDEEQHKKEYPSTQEEVISGLNDPSITKMTISKEIPLSGNSLTIASGRTLTIDISEGKIETGTMTEDAAFTVQNGGNLTLKTSLANGTVDASNIAVALKVTKKNDLSTDTATLTIDGGTYIGKYYGVSGNGTRQNTSVTINGDTTIKATQTDDSVAIFQPQKGDLTINNGTFEAANTVWIKSGNVVINGGSFKSTGVSAAYVPSGNGFNNTGDCILVDNCNYPGGQISIRINGGTFYSENANPVASYSISSLTPLSGFVYGGTFNKPIDEWLIAEGYELSTVVENEKYMVVKSN